MMIFKKGEIKGELFIIGIVAIVGLLSSMQVNKN